MTPNNIPNRQNDSSFFFRTLFGIGQALDSSCVHFDSQHTQRHPFAKPAENPEESGKLYIGMAILNL